MEVRHLRIQNFRCYKDACISLDRPFLLITGSNDGGKSALLCALELFLYSRAKPDEADFRSLDPDGERVADEIRLIARVESDGEDIMLRRRFWIEEDELEHAYEKEKEVPVDEELREALSNFTDWYADEQKEYLANVGIELTGRTNQGERYEKLEQYAETTEKTTDWVEISSPNFPTVNRYLSEEMNDPIKDVQKFLKGAVEDHIHDLKKDGGEYAEIERKVEQAGKEQLKVLEGVFSRYDYGEDKTKLEPDIDFDLLRGLSLNALKVHQDENERPLKKLGSARRRKLMLALQEWRLESLHTSDEPTSLVLLYDEPDNHFDYEAQRKLLAILLDLSEHEGVQVIVATHSLNLIDSVEPENIIYLDQEIDEQGVTQSHVERLGNWDEIYDIAKMLGLRNHIVLNACVLCTEGETEEILLPALYRIDRGRSLSSIGVEMVRGSVRGDDATWRLCKHMLRNNRDAFLFLDSDAQQPGSGNVIDSDAIRTFNENEGKPLVTEDKNVVFLGEKEIEDLFEDRTLAIAFERYLIEDAGGKLKDKEDSHALILQARLHTDGLCGGLQKETYQRTNTTFSKTSFCKRLVEVVQEDPTHHPVPGKIQEAFDMLEAYIDPER